MQGARIMRRQDSMQVQGRTRGQGEATGGPEDPRPVKTAFQAFRGTIAPYGKALQPFGYYNVAQPGATVR